MCKCLDRRYDSDFLTVQSLLSRGVLGTVHDFEVHYDFDLPEFILNLGDTKYTPGQGILFMIGVHKIDQVLHLFGTPSAVTGFTRSLRTNAGDFDVEDSFILVLNYSKSGLNPNLVVTIKCNAASKMKKQLGYFVRGYNGSFIKFGSDIQEDQLQSGIKPTEANFGMEPEESWGELTTYAQVDDNQEKIGDLWVGKVPCLPGNYLFYYADVVSAIRGGKQIVRPETSRDGLKVIELARDSMVQGRTLPFLS